MRGRQRRLKRYKKVWFISLKRQDWCYIPNEDGVEMLGLKIIVEVCRVADLKVPKMFDITAVQ